MSKEKQIEEMAKDLQETHDYEGCEAWHCGDCEYEKYGKNYFCSSIKQAEKMTTKGYRKQSEGEWQKPSRYSEPVCTICKKSPCQYFGMLPPFCPNCGAKMKGGAE